MSHNSQSTFTHRIVHPSTSSSAPNSKSPKRAQLLLLPTAKYANAPDNSSDCVPISKSLLPPNRATNTMKTISRFSSAAYADRVLVLANGGLAQEGTFGELCATPGIFADELQSLMATLQVSRAVQHRSKVDLRTERFAYLLWLFNARLRARHRL